MKSGIEQYLIGHCAPTQAGIKVGSLFHYSAERDEDICLSFSFLNGMLQKKGVTRQCLKKTAGGCLVYVYRPSMLQKLLKDNEIRIFLNIIGYAGCSDTESYRFCLRQKLSDSRFPHEIGIFLSYPLHDVQGFHYGLSYHFAGKIHSVNLFDTGR